MPILRAARLLTDPEFAREQYITSVSVIEVPVGKFIRPGEFVMSSGINVGHKARLLAGFLREIAEAGASALAVAIGPHTPRVPKYVVKCANQLKLPLLELSWEVRFSEISEAILRQIIHETSRIRSRDQFVWSLASHSIIEDAVNAEGIQLGFDLNRNFVGIVAKLSNLGGQPRQHIQPLARFIEGLCAKLAMQDQLQWIGTVTGDAVVGFLQIPRTKGRILHLLEELQAIAREKCALSCGVGRVCAELTDFAKSYEDARIACQLGMRTRGEGSITDVSDVLADRVLLVLQHDPHTSLLLNRYVEPLKRFRRIPLLRTLEIFFDADCNASEAARKLSISRQSLRYRLGKIEDILHANLHRAEDRFAILFSLRIHKLRSDSKL